MVTRGKTRIVRSNVLFVTSRLSACPALSTPAASGLALELLQDRSATPATHPSEGKISVGWTPGFGDAYWPCIPCVLRPRRLREPSSSAALHTGYEGAPHHLIFTRARSTKRSTTRAGACARAGVEGVRACGIRRSRYVGLAKTTLQRVFTAVGINAVRIVAWLDGQARAKTRDLTHIATDEGWLSLAVMIVLFSRQVVDWSLRKDMVRDRRRRRSHGVVQTSSTQGQRTGLIQRPRQPVRQPGLQESCLGVRRHGIDKPPRQLMGTTPAARRCSACSRSNASTGNASRHDVEPRT